MPRFILCHFHEVALKKKNRSFFENKVVQNVNLALQGLPVLSVERRMGRIVVAIDGDSATERALERLLHVFGLVSLSPAWECSPELDEMCRTAWHLVKDRNFQTFKVHTRRADKNFPIESPRVNEVVGEYLASRTGKKVQLDHPDLTCFIHVVGERAFVYFDRIRGAGGLPVSSAGKVVVLISGGIDSPVAAYKVIRRGCQAVFVHFHSLPHTSPASLEKVRELVQLLCRYQFRGKLYLVPFAEIQRKIVAETPVPTRVILYRRMMLRIAEQIAQKENALALITGDSIGQVSSQTLENLRAISEAVELPILRPLIGDDKEEIIGIAERIGSFKISTRPDEDCCSLFVPRHPETRASLGAIHESEDQLDISGLIKSLRRKVPVEKFEWNQPQESEEILAI